MMVGRICPPGWNRVKRGHQCPRVKVSENLGTTAVIQVAPVDTSLKSIRLQHYIDFKLSLARNINIHFILRFLTKADILKEGFINEAIVKYCAHLLNLLL